MKKLATILSILTLSFGAFASDIKTADTLVSEFSAIKGKAETQAYIMANYDSIYASYEDILALKLAGDFAESDKSKTKAYVDTRKVLFRLMILSDTKKFISNTEGIKSEVAFMSPLALVQQGKEAMHFERAWINANMESIASMWNSYIALDEKPTLSPLKVRILKTYLTQNKALLKEISFADVANITPALWIIENEISYADLRLSGFVIEEISLTNSVIFYFAKQADDYAYISTMGLNGLNEKDLSSYVSYMTSKILALSDSEAYKATKTLESKLLRLNSKQAKTLLAKVQSIQDVTYLRVMREGKIK